MFIFDSPELEDNFRNHLDILKSKFVGELHLRIDDCEIFEEPNTEILITPETIIYIDLSEFSEIKLSVSEFFDFVREFDSAVIKNYYECWTSNKVLFSLEPYNIEAHKFFKNAIREPRSSEEEQLLNQYNELNKQKAALYKLIDAKRNSSEDQERALDFASLSGEIYQLSQRLDTPTEYFCSEEFNVGGKSLICRLVKGFTIFQFKVLSEGYISEDDSPDFSYDTFVEILFKTPISEELANNILEAYLFELNSSLGIILKKSPIINPYDEDDFYYPVTNPRLRPLLLGNGIYELLSLYNKGVGSDDPQIQVLLLAKVIEFVSQTVVQQQFNESVRAKLLSNECLNPDAKFISDLATLIEEQSEFKRDREAIRLTVLTCCDAVELAKHSPKYFTELKRLTQNSKRKEKEEALSKVATTISATRNAIAHAKANYQPTGDECPSEEIREFASLLALMAQQVIRWYDSRNDFIKIY